ncbi:hypothetical protein CRYUN_Cryun14cG0017800 [Craigia yunnanensis]
MNQGMASLAQAPSTMSITRVPQFPFFCTKLSQWDPSPFTYAPTEKAGDNFLEKSSEIFETLRSDNRGEASATKAEEIQPSSQWRSFSFLNGQCGCWAFSSPQHGHVATLTGLVIPLMILFGSQKGYLQRQLSFIPYAVLLRPYILLLSLQILTEMLTCHWQSPVRLVTLVVYEAYRVLQLMRGVKLEAELSAPAWMMHTIRGWSVGGC